MTSQRPKRERDTLEYLAGLRRFIRRAGERVADADEFELAELVELRVALEEAITTAVQGQRASTGRSWAHIGMALGITRQSAQERYGKLLTERARRCPLCSHRVTPDTGGVCAVLGCECPRYHRSDLVHVHAAPESTDPERGL